MTRSTFGASAPSSTRYDQHANGIDESVKAQALAEEEAAMNQYKVKIKQIHYSPFIITNK